MPTIASAGFWLRMDRPDLSADPGGEHRAFHFPLCVLFVFLTLAAQYESWALPFSIILIVPMCLLSSLAGVLLRGMDNNIFTQIGFVVLVGLACKNAILIVEYAKQIEDSGKGTIPAVVEACKLRLRPILMTSFAFIAGVVPLMLGSGAGAEMRQTLGTAVFAGNARRNYFRYLPYARFLRDNTQVREAANSDSGKGCLRGRLIQLPDECCAELRVRV